jgi:hypothetical protein
VSLTDSIRRIFGLRTRREEGLIIIARTTSEGEAALWRDILNQWGIPCIVRDRSALAYLHAGGAFELSVRIEDEDHARQLIGPIPPSTPDPDPRP